MIKNIIESILHWKNNGNITTTKNKNNNSVTNNPSNKIESNINLINPNLELVIQNINNAKKHYNIEAFIIKNCDDCKNKLKEAYKKIGKDPIPLYNYDISKWIYNIYNNVENVNEISCNNHINEMQNVYLYYDIYITNKKILIKKENNKNGNIN